LRGTERFQQPVKLRGVGVPESDREVRSLAGGQQLEAGLRQLTRWRHVDGAEAGEPAAEQIVERHVEYGEDGYAEQWLTVQRPGSCRPLSVPA